MLAYPVTDNFKLQLNAYNLANTFYYATSYFTRPGENHTLPGAGRTFLLTAGLSLVDAAAYPRGAFGRGAGANQRPAGAARPGAMAASRRGRNRAR